MTAQLTGSEKQVAWAEKIRTELSERFPAAPHLALALEKISDAGWWIQKRDPNWWASGGVAEVVEERIAAQDKVAALPLPPLSGTEKQVAFGEKCRVDSLVTLLAYAFFSRRNAERFGWLQRLERVATKVREADWWIINRSPAPAPDHFCDKGERQIRLDAVSPRKTA
jgi:hypothetical protein